jgi:cell division transport system permease protein
MAGAATLPLAGDGSARFLPWLIGLMVFLATLAIGAGFAIDAALIRWDDGLRGTLTVQLPPPVAGGPLPEAAVEQVLTLLRGTNGVAGAVALDPKAEARLLQPWLGDSIDAGQLPLPVLIDVQRTESVPVYLPDLARRLGEIVSGATVETHGAWLEQMFHVARLIEAAATVVVGLIGVAAVLTVIFTTRTGLMIHAPIVSLLHMMGASDNYIARQFQWHAFRLGLRGGLIGLVPALLGFAALKYGAESGGVSVADLAPGLRLPILAWVLVVLLPFAMGLVGLVTARMTVLSTLARMP